MFPCVLHNASYFSMLLWKQLGGVFNGLLNFVTSFCSLTRLPQRGNKKQAWKTRQSVNVHQLLKLHNFLSSHKYQVRWMDTWSGLLLSWYLVRTIFLRQRPLSMFLNDPIVGKVCVQKAVSKGLLNGYMNCSTQPHTLSEYTRPWCWLFFIEQKL